jgi:hypothetical protein
MIGAEDLILKGASKSKTQALPIKRQSKPSAKVKANKQVAEPPPSAAPAASRSKKAGGAAARLQAAEGIASRSRSASTKPKAGTEEPAEPVEDQDQEEDDRLYCVCQRRWDENSMMIGCDVYVPAFVLVTPILMCYIDAKDGITQSASRWRRTGSSSSTSLCVRTAQLVRVSYFAV